MAKADPNKRPKKSDMEVSKQILDGAVRQSRNPANRAATGAQARKIDKAASSRRANLRRGGR